MTNSVAVFPPGWRLTDANDDPVSGGTIEFYTAGTTTPKTVYSDNALTVSIGTTVTTDASGYPSSGGNKIIVYTGTADYKVILKKADGTVLATHDNVKGAVTAGGSGSGIWNVPVEAKATTTYTVVSGDFGGAKEFDTAGGNSAVVLPTALSAGVGATFTMIRKTSNSNTATLIASGSDTVAGAGSVTLTSDGDSVTVTSDGASSWKQISFVRRSLAAGAITSDLLESRIVAGLAVVGDIKVVPYSTVPTGWLECDGSAISRTTYADLFAKIGVTHGSGDGATTFNIPDYRGRFIRGWAHGSTRDPDKASRTAMATGGATGDNVGSVQSYALEAHTHVLSGFRGTSFSGGASSVATDANGAASTASASGAVSAGATTSTETRPINANVMFIILASPSAAAGSATFVNTLYNGSGTPSSGLGINGDFYIDTTGNKIHGPKAAGAWPAGVSMAGSTGATGATGGTGIDYTWDTGTTAGDPGAGKIRANNATLSSATALYISETDRLGNGLSALIQSWDDSTSTIKGVLEAIDLTTPANRVFFNVTGTISDNGGYNTITVAYKSGVTSLTAVNVNLLFVPTGDKGTGDLVAANNLSDVASKKTSFDNLSVHGADVASASTIDLDAATGNLVDVTGTTAITAITLSDGRERTVRFTGALTLTNGASLVLPGGSNITTAAGDYAVFRGYAAGVVRCVVYTKASGTAVVSSGGSSAAHGQCRLTKSSTNLLLSPYGGNQIMINGAAQTVPDAGVTLAATSLSVGTTYNIYVFMSGGTMTLEASTTAHATDTASGNKGIEIKSGDATRTLVGMARIITGPAWVDTDAQRFVISWFNRRTITGTNIFTANRNTTTGSTYTEVNSEIRNEFLTWADESVPVGVAGSGFLNTSGDQVYIGVGFDSATPEQGNLAFQSTLAIGPLGLVVTKSGLSEGYHYATVTAKQTVGSAAFTIVSSATGQRTALSCAIRG